VPPRLGVFIVPDATDPAATLEQVIAAERSGLDLVGIQDHPYQRRFFDTWTLLAYLAARTERIALVPDVINLPLRPPAVLAKAAASLDVLSGGRFELGLGAGAFWDRIDGFGGPRRTPKESVDALIEAITILRAFWSGERSVTFEGEHYRVTGAEPGPPPAHRIGIWLGAYGPRMLRVTGRVADGWLPSIGTRWFPHDAAPGAHAAIDEAARKAGRDPAEIERAVNVTGLGDDPVGELERVLGELRFTTAIVGIPDGEDKVGFVRRLGEGVAARVRERL
jgi:alkanesulfonate monooxygenase SsuD/methylene tetrahydromethanopterin reductase-like flavin-dependent oxidoreductase (luciferase family)